jgi:hypothetical protein
MTSSGDTFRGRLRLDLEVTLGLESFFLAMLLDC